MGGEDEPERAKLYMSMVVLLRCACWKLSCPGICDKFLLLFAREKANKKWIKQKNNLKTTEIC